MSKQRAIWAAYNDTGSLNVDCPNCGAEPKQWCTKPDGRVRRIPCIERSTATAIVTIERDSAYRDFSEPAHHTPEQEGP